MAPVQPNASVAATGLGIRYIGKFAYGYSGIVGCDNNDTIMMEFTTGSGFIDMKVLVCNSVSLSTGDDFRYSVYLNDVICTQWYGLGVQDPLAGRNPLPFLIPPFTKMTIRADNQGGTAKRDHTVNIVGRVYGAE